MTDHALRRSAAWTLAVLLAIVAGLGEGLHMIPGLGHGVLVGQRVLLLGETPAGRPSEFGAGPCCVCNQCDESIPVLDEDDCPICQIIGASFAPGAAAAVMAVDIVAGKPVAEPLLAAAFSPAVYQARAPPQG